MRERVLVLFETAWDRPQLESCRSRWSGRYALDFAEPSDADCAWDLDVVDYLAREGERRRAALEGVFSMSDYPGATLAAALATDLGLPGSRPLAVLRASHKYESRLRQRVAAPEAVPGFALVDPEDPATFAHAVGYPCFVKPVKGAFSIMSGVVSDPGELARFVRAPVAERFRKEFLRIFNDLALHFGLDFDGRFFLAEELLRGRHATVEGWRSRSGSGLLGVVDSSFHPGTGSFSRFDYPSELPAQVQRRMGSIATRVAAHLELEDTLFNVEMVWESESDRVSIIEVNPRGCGQFADLYDKVDGVSGYEAALAVAVGQTPPRRRGGRYRAATSFPLRVFEPCRVRAVPDAARIAAARELFPDTLVWVECSAGEELADFRSLEDGSSFRYAVVNVGAQSRAEADGCLDAVLEVLGFDLQPSRGGGVE